VAFHGGFAHPGFVSRPFIHPGFVGRPFHPGFVRTGPRILLWFRWTGRDRSTGISVSIPPLRLSLPAAPVSVSVLPAAILISSPEAASPCFPAHGGPVAQRGLRREDCQRDWPISRASPARWHESDDSPVRPFLELVAPAQAVIVTMRPAVSRMPAAPRW
jgi:hypothetical protein